MKMMFSLSSSLPSTKSHLLVFGLMLCGLKSIQTSSASKLEIVTSIQDDLEFDENNKLSKHYVVFPANRPDCATNLWETGEEETSYGFAAHPIEGDALAKVFPDAEEEKNECMAACLERGTDVSLAGHTMPQFHYRSGGLTKGAVQAKHFRSWFNQHCLKVEICFINYYVEERPLKVYWIHPTTGERLHRFDLKYSERNTNCFSSFLGHRLEAIDEESGFREEYVAEYTATKAFGTSPPSSSQKFDGIEEVEKTVKNALDHEWSRHNMVERTFSSLGFAKGRLDDDIFANMGAFYYNNRNNAVNEEWTGKGVFVNWWETDVRFVSIPWHTKRVWQDRLNTMVSKWAGVEIEETSMYGLRQYEEGARLLSHVDRIPTHAVSLIVNIAQNNLASPWPVEVFDHGDRLHEVTMEPGDIVYYESAKNLHSRNRPLTCKQGGCQYVNLFTHYRPVGDGDRWHRNLSDMPNRPPPLSNGASEYDHGKSSCRLPEGQQAQHENNTLDNHLGVGTVECEDRRLGSYMSPTLYRLNSGRDLFRWWKATADPNFSGFDDPDGTDDAYDAYELQGDEKEESFNDDVLDDDGVYDEEEDGEYDEEYEEDEAEDGNDEL
ncbi:unnamed protein product [Pseudo-nitzschia multistriata]|uniref:Uncharacterized protein n=1 Tax=Pseudo-nitzschia multistriata TaxID=183589 RepID=A0A448ZBH9_9STRA|nr:unnamed protein product [Pseudo-nitzschia multistriata]